MSDNNEYYGKKVYIDSGGNKTVWVRYYDSKGNYVNERVLITNKKAKTKNIESPFRR